VGDDPEIVFEHPGRETMGASVFVVKRGGTVVTCAATSGPMIEFDNRHLWMKLKRLVSSHGANYAEAWAANRLVCQGRIHPTLSAVYPLERTGEAAWLVQQNRHEGKVGVLCLAPQEGLGVEDRELRERVGERRLDLFRRHARERRVRSRWIPRRVSRSTSRCVNSTAASSRRWKPSS
jgi:crotonyl-CoA reductase